MDAITIDHVTKRYGTVPVLNGVSLRVRQGEIFTLLGENGAGKSTLINIVTTLLRADSGEVRVMGLDVAHQGGVRQLISLNAQMTTLDEEFSGYENLKMMAQLRRITNVQAEIEQVSDRLDLQSFLTRKVRTYSGGMRRRLDLAMSLIGDPDLIFLDEPTTGVDPKSRLALWQMIREMRDRGKTVFLTTQYLDEADALSDHIAFLHDGQIVRDGTPQEIKQTTQNRYQLTVEPEQLAVVEQLLAQQHIIMNRDGDQLVGDENQANLAMAVLLEAGIPVTRYEVMVNDLETIFLNLTQQEVAQ